MKTLKFQSLGKVVSVALFALVFGLGLIMGPKALADNGDGRFTIIGSVSYPVYDNSSGPHIRLNGEDIYLQADQSDRVVIVNGHAYPIYGFDHYFHHHHHWDWH